MKVAIVGNGIAGITAAKSISENLRGSSIKVFADENYNYYPRPLLDRLLSGSLALEAIFPYDDNWYRSRGIEVSLGDRVTSMDVKSKKLEATRSGTMDFDKVLLATGASPFMPPIEGISAEEVFTYRNIADVMRIRSFARGKKRAVVLGGGLLGLETAKSLTELGLKVTVVEHNSRLLPRQLDDEGAAILKAMVEKAGIEVILSGAPGGLEADICIVSAGVRPNVGLARTCGIGVEKGIVVDGFMQPTCRDVYAAGDCAEFNKTVYGIIPAAIEQGLAAASNIIGRPFEYKGTTFQATLKVIGIDLASIGKVNPEGAGYEAVCRKDPSRGLYRKCVIKDGKVVGAIVIGEKTGVVTLTRMVKEGTDVSKDKEALMGDDAALSKAFLKGPQV